MKKALKDLLREVEKLVGKKLVEERRRVNEALRGGNRMTMRDALRHLKELMRREKKKREWKPRFCENDYNSGDGFQTSTWGPPCWTFLHFTSLNYIPERKEGYQMLLRGLEKTLPCGHCRNNFSKNYAQAELAMLEKHGIDNIWACRKTFSLFVWELHHAVNVMLGKDVREEPTFEQMRDMYEMFRSRCLTPEEIEAAKTARKEKGCLDSPYGADAKASCVIKFEPRRDLTKVHSPFEHIDERCWITKKN